MSASNPQSIPPADREPGRRQLAVGEEHRPGGVVISRSSGGGCATCDGGGCRDCVDR